jgi:WD40 repeat protein
VWALAQPGRALAGGCAGDGAARLWTNTPGKDVEPVVLGGHADRATTLAFSPDGRWLATGSADSTVRLEYTAAIHQPTVLSGHEINNCWL